MEIFVIMPFSKTTKIHDESYWNRFFGILQRILEKRLRDSFVQELKWDSVSVRRADAPQGHVVDSIIHDLIEADLLVAVLTDYNPNVLYELGIRHSLSQKPTIMLIQKRKKIPFDFNVFGVGKYGDSSDLEEQLEAEIKTRITHIAQNPKRADNPVVDYQMKGGESQFGKRQAVRIRVVDQMPQETHEWIPRFYREQSTDKEPLPSIIIAFVMECLNAGQRKIAIDKATLHVSIAGEHYQTDELFAGGRCVSEGKTHVVDTNYRQPFGLGASDPQTFRIALRLRHAVPNDLTDLQASIELVDVDHRSYDSGEFDAFNKKLHLRTRLQAERFMQLKEKNSKRE